MFSIKLTASLQRTIGLRGEMLLDPFPSEEPLGNWLAKDFPLGHRTAYVFMSEPTLLSFILFQGETRLTVESFPQLLVGGLEQLLVMHGIPRNVIKGVIARYGVCAYAKPDSRSDVASLNSTAGRYQWLVDSNGGLGICDLNAIIKKMNNMPQKRLGWRSSWEVSQARLAVLRPSQT